MPGGGVAQEGVYGGLRATRRENSRRRGRPYTRGSGGFAAGGVTDEKGRNGISRETRDELA